MLRSTRSITTHFSSAMKRRLVWLQPSGAGLDEVVPGRMACTFQTGQCATLACKALHTGQPPYLSELLQHYEPTRTLRSSSSFQFSVPRYNLEFGSRAFLISAPKIWNLLPASICNSPLPTFRRHLKTHYFQSASAYPNP